MLNAKKDILVRLAVFVACVLAGWQAWHSARWLVGRDDVYLGLVDKGFGLVVEATEIIAYFGLVTLLFSVVLGVFAAVLIPRESEGTEGMQRT